MDNIGRELQEAMEQLQEILAFKNCPRWVLTQGHTIVVNGKQHNLKAYPATEGSVVWMVYVKEVDSVYWSPG